MANNIDIKFIAEKSGCSIATVSRVMNRSKPVSEKLQKKVIDTIKKYNYNPSVPCTVSGGQAVKAARIYNDKLYQSVSASAISISE